MMTYGIRGEELSLFPSPSQLCNLSPVPLFGAGMHGKQKKVGHCFVHALQNKEVFL